MITIVIPVLDNVKITNECLTSVFKMNRKNPEFEVVVIDNGSTDKNLEHCLSLYPVKVIRNEINLGYVKAVNQGIEYALKNNKCTDIILMNNDVEVYNWWLTDLFNMVHSNPNIGIVSGWNNFLCKHFLATFDLVIIKRKVFEKIGLLDERYGIGCFDDHDLCLRAELAGFDIYRIPMQMVHKEHSTIKNFNRDKLIKTNYIEFIDKFKDKFKNEKVYKHLISVIDHYEKMFSELKEEFYIDIEKKVINKNEKM